MDFFETQQTSNRQSLVLLAAFATVFFVCFTAVYWFASFIAYPIHWLFDGLSTGLIKWSLIGLFAVVIAVGCFKRWRDVSEGGERIARLLGAQEVERSSASAQDKQFLNTVEEMAVAANVLAPQCYCLRGESSINAMVAGNKKSTALIVTQGALDKLSTDEFRAVVGHEMGHIVNNDLVFTMRLLIALGGLNAISEAGYHCFEPTQIKASGTSASAHDIGVAGYALLIVMGVFLCVIGSFFKLCGDILKAAFSRKRELYADAKSVQFTRNTWGLASALNKIAEDSSNRRLSSVYSAEIAHMCIDRPRAHFLFPRLLATHPPLQTRIDTVEPHFDVKNRKKTRTEEEPPAANTGWAGRTQLNAVANPAHMFVSLVDCDAELAVLLAMVIQSGGYDADVSRSKYEQTLKTYTGATIPMAMAGTNDAEHGLNDALEKLALLPPMQRQNLLDHIAEIMEHDGIKMQSEADLLEIIRSRLNPPAAAA